MAIIVAFNMVIFGLVVRTLSVSAAFRKRTGMRSERMQQVAIYVSLLATLGFTWIFGYVALVSGVTAMWYPFIVFNGGQGILICFAYCFRERVIAEWKSRWLGLVSAPRSTQTTKSTDLTAQQSPARIRRWITNMRPEARSKAKSGCVWS